MIKYILFLIISLFLFSCTNSSNSNLNTQSKDSITIENLEKPETNINLIAGTINVKNKNCNFDSTFIKYKIEEFGFIHIPKSMELQSEEYRKKAQAANRFYGYYYIPKLKGRYVFQQKELNDIFQQKELNKTDDAINTYVRVIIETEYGELGSFQRITDPISFTKSDFVEFDKEVKQQLLYYLEISENKLLNWYGSSIMSVNNQVIINFSYLRQLQNNPPVFVNIYKFQNNDRLYTVTLSYRQADAKKWEKDINKIICGLKIIHR